MSVEPEDSNSRWSFQEVTPAKLERLEGRMTAPDKSGNRGLTSQGFEQLPSFSRENSRMSAPELAEPQEGARKHDSRWFSEPGETPGQGSPSKRAKHGESDLLSTNSKMSANPNSSSPNKLGPLDNYFQPRTAKDKSASDKPSGQDKQLKAELAELRDKLKASTEEVERQKERLEAMEQEQKQADEAHNSMMQEMRSELGAEVAKREKRDKLCRGVLEDVMVQNALQQRTEARERCRREGVRLGQITMRQNGPKLASVWENGQAFLELANKLNEVQDSRDRAKEHLARLRKEKQKRLRNSSDAAPNPESTVFEEITKLKLKSLDKEEAALVEQKERLEEEKKLHVRELTRIRAEDESRFSDYDVLPKSPKGSSRYLLTNLLGRGGFSEAYDLKDLREVVIKLHQLHSHWSEDRKLSYQKHATREYHIHRSLAHENIVKLHDVFTIDSNCFATVMEFCAGKDLDHLLQVNRTVSEKEAKLIILQVLEGLRYLNTQKQRVIHYDLKPANILFSQDGVVKITDFGLSKIMDDDNPHDMELTSQGAGTYWYLPPECFEKGSLPPRISTKVDVWSTGIIFYQMLFGTRPFGEGIPQEQVSGALLGIYVTGRQMYHEGTITNAKHVEFPTNPKVVTAALMQFQLVGQVTNECKEVIRKCLAHSQDTRPDITVLLQDPYFKPAAKRT